MERAAAFERAKLFIAEVSKQCPLFDRSALAWDMKVAPPWSVFGHAFVRIVRCDHASLKSRMRDAIFCIAIQTMCQELNAPPIVPLTSVAFFRTLDGAQWFAMTQQVAPHTMYSAIRSNYCDPGAIIRRTLDAIAYMHEVLCVFHGDLHSRNVLVMEDGSVRMCDFELAMSCFFNTHHKFFHSSTGADAPRFPLLRSTLSMSTATKREENNTQFDHLHWSHAKWFMRDADCARSMDDFSRDQIVAPFGSRYDIDVAMLVASVPAFKDGIERSIFCEDTYESACLSWALVGAQPGLPAFLGPHQLLPYIFCAPVDHHVCSVAAHSVRDAIPKHISFPFAVARGLAAALGARPLSAGALGAARNMCHAQFARAVAPANIFDAPPMEAAAAAARVAERFVRGAVVLRALVRSAQRDARAAAPACCCSERVSSVAEVVDSVNAFIGDQGGTRGLCSVAQCASFLRNLFFFAPVFCRTANVLTLHSARIMQCVRSALAHCCPACAQPLCRSMVLLGAFRCAS
jgi:hypothetical protein